MPKVIYTNTSVEYLGSGTICGVDASHGRRDERCHGARERAHLSPGWDAAWRGGVSTNAWHRTGTGQSDAAGQRHAGTAPRRASVGRARSTRPPDSRHPMLRDQTLVPLEAVGFPAIPGVSDPRTIEGPGPMDSGHFTALPFLVPRVDADGNEVTGIRVPELAVPLATTTGWNFRAERVGNPIDALRAARARTSRSRERRPSATRDTIRACQSKNAIAIATTTCRRFAPRPRHSSKIACCFRRMSTTSSQRATKHWALRDRRRRRRTDA